MLFDYFYLAPGDEAMSGQASSGGLIPVNCTNDRSSMASGYPGGRGSLN